MVDLTKRQRAKYSTTPRQVHGQDGLPPTVRGNQPNRASLPHPTVRYISPTSKARSCVVTRANPGPRGAGRQAKSAGGASGTAPVTWLTTSPPPPAMWPLPLPACLLGRVSAGRHPRRGRTSRDYVDVLGMISGSDGDYVLGFAAKA